MADISDALKLVKKDPVVGFVSIPIVAARPPAKTIIVEKKGQRLLLPDWSALEWLWYGSLAMRLNNRLTAVNDEGVRSKKRALDKLVSLHNAIGLLSDDGQPLPNERVRDYYDAAVRLVIAASAAHTDQSRGDLAVEVFTEALKEAPMTILRFLGEALSSIATTALIEIPKASLAILRDWFKTATGIDPLRPFGLPLPLLVLGGIGAYWYLTSNRR